MVICTMHRTIDIVFGNFNETELFQPFLTKELPAKLILPLQMSEGIRKEIDKQKNAYIQSFPPQIYRYFSIFDNIDNGEWFYAFPEECFQHMTEYERGRFIDFQKVYLYYKNNGLEDEKINKFMKEFEEHIDKYLAPLERIYDIVCYTKMSNKFYLGEKDKSKRVCRFCGKKMPDVTFNDSAHTIPLAFGNHIFFSNYECDVCNHFFGEKVEPHLRQWIACMLFFSRTRGRSGIPDLKFTNGFMKYDEDENLFVIIQKGDGTGDKQISFSNDTEIPVVQLGDGVPYIPSMVYKALVKVALGFVPDEKIEMFEETIAWLMNEEDNRALPQIAYALSIEPVINPQPEITLFLRKNEISNDLPSAVASLSMCGMHIVCVIPFCKSDNGVDFTSDDAYENYWNTFALYSESPMSWTSEDLSMTTPVTPRLNLKFQQRKDNV